MRGPCPFATGDDASTPVHVAVVLSTDGVRAVVAATTRDRLFAGLADYVARAAADRLWPADARRTQALLAMGAHEAAVAHYVASVGKRWDEEWLELVALERLVPADGAVAVNAGGDFTLDGGTTVGMGASAVAERSPRARDHEAAAV